MAARYHTNVPPTSAMYALAILLKCYCTPESELVREELGALRSRKNRLSLATAPLPMRLHRHSKRRSSSLHKKVFCTLAGDMWRQRCPIPH